MAQLETLSSNTSCYYELLGLCKQATPNEIRRAYRTLALKWHPDRWMKDPQLAREAKQKFQQIQEAYSVLSDNGKRSVYDAGLIELLSDDDDENFTNFMQEMAATVKRTRNKDGHSVGDLQEMLYEMVSGSNNTPILPRKKSRTF